MIILSLYVQRVGGTHNNLSLERMLDVYNPDILMLQETTCLGHKVVDFLDFVLKDWNYSSLDAISLYGGMVTSWNQKIDSISSLMMN